MTARALCATAILLLAGMGCTETQNETAVDKRPNILLIVADDLGYADLGIYGGDIDTPNIDALARSGMLFTQFHTAPLCAPTRAMLLSGNNNHVAGMASQGTSGLGGEPMRGYENHLSNRIVPFPKLLRDTGYRTMIVGKWHLGVAPENSPVNAGFEFAYNLLEGGGNHFNSKGFLEGGMHYQEGTERVEYPDGRYSTDLYTEKLIGFIDSTKNDDRPFFAFAAYTSPHWPLQVPDEYLDLYSGRYDDGYDVLREERFASLKEAGIIPIDSELPPRNDAVTPWDDLSADDQKRESRKMELYAAMVDNLDDHVGRLLDHLKANGEFENTIVIFMSDNGAAGEDFYQNGPFVDYIQREYDNSYEKMGTAESFVCYGLPWAEAGSAPFQRYKGYTREGGITAPMIIAGTGVSASDDINTAYATVMDLAPTFLELAGAPYPDDGSVEPILGESMVSFLAGESEDVHDDQYVTTLFHENVAFLRQGDWKLSTLDGIFEESKFELFDLSVDPGETNNLATDEPEKYAELIALWQMERKRLGIIVPKDL